MLFFIVLLCLSIMACQAEQTPKPVFCGAMPKMYNCLNMPRAVRHEISAQCGSSLDECARMTCVATKLGWMKENKIDPEKFSAHFDQMAKEYPEWQMVVDHIKSRCISDLPAQGIHLNCPAYDSIICSFISFIKNAKPFQWKTSPECVYPRQFAGACPICPNDCFATAIPTGSCNACLTLPRSP